MKIYISGKTSGDLQHVKQKFAIAEEKLRNTGAAPVNPVKLGVPDNFSDHESHFFRMKAIRHCNAIFMLTDAMLCSKCEIELKEARRLGLTIYFEAMEPYDEITDCLKIAVVR